MIKHEEFKISNNIGITISARCSVKIHNELFSGSAFVHYDELPQLIQALQQVQNMKESENEL